MERIKKITETSVLLVCLFLFLLNSECPLQKLLGIPCPGCNMSTALYYLLQGNIESALFYHPLVIVFILCVIVEVCLYIKYKHLYDKTMMYILYAFVVLLVVVYMYRMVTIFPDIPMVYVEENVFTRWKTLFF